MRIVTLPLLAGSYRAGRANLKALLTHSFDADVGAAWETTKTLCGKVKGASVCDEYAHTEEERAAAPTCELCAKRDPRFQK